LSECTFAHISDPHLTSLEGVKPGELLNKRLLGYLSWRTRRREEHQRHVLEALLRDLQSISPEQLAITGDLTQIGLPREFVEARQWLERVGPSSRVTLVPGNHDAYVAARWDSTFALWASYMQSDSADTAETWQNLFPSLRVRGELALIGVSSARPSAPFLAVGSLGLSQRQALKRMLEGAGQRGLFRILLIHHPPLAQVTGWRKRLTDSDSVQAVLQAAGVELVLHGHTHRPEQHWMEIDKRRIPVIGVSSASAIGSRPGRHAQYGSYRLSTDGGRWNLRMELRGYSPADDRFVLEASRDYRIDRPS
jgi:3',5'-cyclic AMP phosphodiesterase CpdA